MNKKLFLLIWSTFMNSQSQRTQKQFNCPPITVITFLGLFVSVDLVFSQSKFLGLVVPTGMIHELGLQMLSGYYILLESYGHDFH